MTSVSLSKIMPHIVMKAIQQIYLRVQTWVCEELGPNTASKLYSRFLSFHWWSSVSSSGMLSALLAPVGL